jgi:hypothetical protein
MPRCGRAAQRLTLAAPAIAGRPVPARRRERLLQLAPLQLSGVRQAPREPADLSPVPLDGLPGEELGGAEEKTLGATPTCSGYAEFRSLCSSAEFRREPCTGGVRGNLVATKSTGQGGGMVVVR